MNIPNSRLYKNFECELQNPQIAFGKNWLTVLHFWRYLDSLTKEQKITLQSRFVTYSERHSYASYSQLLYDRVSLAHPRFPFISLFLQSVNYTVLTRATFEIILMDQLLDEGYKMVFLPMFEV